jgi:membrane protease YdiL (CAAX protease family)
MIVVMLGERAAKILGVALRVGLYALLAYFGLLLFAWVLSAIGAYLVTSALGVFLAATGANGLLMHIYERASLTDIGLGWSQTSVRNLLIGLAGGTGAACMVLALPVLFRAAEFRAVAGGSHSLRTALFVGVVLILGALGEEMLFRGYAFQVLVEFAGPYATVLPFGLLFGFAHMDNLNSSALSVANTSAWGVLLGYAFLKSGDLWLPTGLHLGWNWALPLFGVNLSGFTMEVTGYSLRWRIPDVWSGGAYGPEGGLLTSITVVLLFFYLWYAPVRRQPAFLVPSLWED